MQNDLERIEARIKYIEADIKKVDQQLFDSFMRVCNVLENLHLKIVSTLLWLTFFTLFIVVAIIKIANWLA